MRRQEDIEAELADIHAQREWPQHQADELRTRIADKSQAAQAREWVLGYTTATRPRGTPIDGSQEGTERVRRKLLQEVAALREELAPVEEQLSELARRENALREELRQVERDSITPEMLAARIKAANAELAKFVGTRHKLEKELQQAAEQRSRVDAAIAAEAAARAELEAARAAAFLDDAAEGETAAVKAAKVALRDAVDHAAAANAALPEIERRAAAAQLALDMFDAERTGRRRQIAGLERQLAVLRARLAFNAATEAQRAALCELYAVDPDAALKHAEALRARGLVVLDGDGGLQQPAWLQGAHTVSAMRRVLAQQEAR